MVKPPTGEDSVYLNCYVIKIKNVSFFFFSVNKSQSTVTHHVAFVQPSYAVPFTQTKLAGETFSPILFEGKGRWTQTSHNGTDV